MAPHRMPSPPSIPPDLNALVNDLIDQPSLWWQTPNDQLGGERPQDLLGTPKEQAILDLLQAIKHGMFA